MVPNNSIFVLTKKSIFSSIIFIKCKFKIKTKITSNKVLTLAERDPH
jgi:hypothetical protein